MRWFSLWLALLTLTAYALGLPVWIHEGDHRAHHNAETASETGVGASLHGQAAAASGHGRLMLLARDGNAEGKGPVKKQGPKGCAVCVMLHALIVAPDVPVTLVSASGTAPEAVVVGGCGREARMPAETGCRGPPGA